MSLDPETIISAALGGQTGELLTPENLRRLTETGVPLNHYTGFKISGFVHFGAISMQKVADLQNVGVKTRIFLAGYHSWMRA